MIGVLSVSSSIALSCHAGIATINFLTRLLNLDVSDGDARINVLTSSS